MVKACLIMDCVRAVSVAYGVPVRWLLSRDASHPVAHPRQAVMLLARWEGYSTPRIGRELGGRDHTTVIYGARAAERRYDADELYGDRLQAAWLNLRAGIRRDAN